MWEWLATESALWALHFVHALSGRVRSGAPRHRRFPQHLGGRLAGPSCGHCGEHPRKPHGLGDRALFSRKILPAGAPQGGENSFACQAPRRLASSLFLAARRGGFPARRVGLAAASVSSLRPLYRRREISAVSPSDSALVRYFGVNRKEEFPYKNASFVRL